MFVSCCSQSSGCSPLILPLSLPLALFLFFRIVRSPSHLLCATPGLYALFHILFRILHTRIKFIVSSLLLLLLLFQTHRICDRLAVRTLSVPLSLSLSQLHADYTPTHTKKMHKRMALQSPYATHTYIQHMKFLFNRCEMYVLGFRFFMLLFVAACMC